MPKDYDANPLHSREENSFTTALLDFFEEQAEARSRALNIAVNENLRGMKVEGKDVSSVVRQLEDAEKLGMRYVMLEKDKGSGALKPASLQFFSSKEEANYGSFLHNSVQGKNVEVLPIREILQDIQKQTALHQVRMQNMTEQSALTIDTGRLRSNELARQEIFTSEIAGKLKEQQIQPDVKQLRELIAKDQPQFVISGRQLEAGKEKAVNITIEQDAHRAFHISAIEPQKENERHKSMKLLQQEELLGGRLHREDAGGVKQMMEAQREAGNRFVAFENGQVKIKGEHFIGFENALKAVEFVHEKAERENKQYLFRSISVIEKEADRVIGNIRENPKDLEKQPEQDAKRSRGIGLER